MHYLHNSRLNKYSRQKRNRLMYFQLKIDYYSNEANKNKYWNFQLIASTKNNLKTAGNQIVQGIVRATTTCHTLLLWLESTLLLGLVVTWKYIFQVQVMLVWGEQGISHSIFTSIRYTYIKTNKVIHNAGSHVYLYILSTNMGVLPLHGLIVASLRINQIYIKRDKVKIKPYLLHNHSIG